MGNSFGGWNFSGHAYKHQADVTNARTIHALTRDATNDARSAYVPNDCAIFSLEIYFDTIAGGANTVTVSLWRDVAGDIMLVGEDSYTIVTGTTTATDGSVRVTYAPDVDHHRYPSSVNGDSDANVTLYVGLRLNAGTAKANVLCNWRA